MNYEKAKEAMKRNYIVEDGFGGKTATVGLSFDEDNGVAIEVAECGCYRASGRKYASEAEMLYYFDHHQGVHFPQVVSNLS